jgi:hypothetical protein
LMGCFRRRIGIASHLARQFITLHRPAWHHPAARRYADRRRASIASRW